MSASNELEDLRRNEGFLAAQMVEFRNQANLSRNVMEAAQFRRKSDEAGMELQKVKRKRYEIESLF